MCEGTRRNAFSCCASGIEYGTAVDGDVIAPRPETLLRATSATAAANSFLIVAFVLGQRHSIVSVEWAIRLPA
jgi:hypothetical protein